MKITKCVNKSSKGIYSVKKDVIIILILKNNIFNIKMYILLNIKFIFGKKRIVLFKKLIENMIDM